MTQITSAQLRLVDVDPHAERLEVADMGCEIAGIQVGADPGRQIVDYPGNGREQAAALQPRLRLFERGLRLVKFGLGAGSVGRIDQSGTLAPQGLNVGLQLLYLLIRVGHFLRCSGLFLGEAPKEFVVPLGGFQVNLVPLEGPVDLDVGRASAALVDGL
jgi:hypothetical protein